MSSPKRLTYWMAAAIENRTPTMTDPATGLKTPYGSKAYLDIQVNLGTVSGTWEFCANENGSCTCVGLIRYGLNPYWTEQRYSSGAVTCNNANFGDPNVGAGKQC